MTDHLKYTVISMMFRKGSLKTQTLFAWMSRSRLLVYLYYYYCFYHQAGNFLKIIFFLKILTYALVSFKKVNAHFLWTLYMYF